MDARIVANWVAQIAFNVAIWVFIGPKAFVFMLLSFFFSVGLHPLMHVDSGTLPPLDENQETYSYHGPPNAVAFNVGYHNEHHDFPSVPWNKLPELKKDASEYYDSLKYHTSPDEAFCASCLIATFRSTIGLCVRNATKVAFTDESRPDAELALQGK